MKIILQRVQKAHVQVFGKTIGKIQQGLLIFCGFEATDTVVQLKKMLQKCLHYRIFSDSEGKMNLSLCDVNGGLLLVPQFTLMADTQKGLRPSFSKAAPPALGKSLFEELVFEAKKAYMHVSSGEFGADMQVYLCNDGPVTFSMCF